MSAANQTHWLDEGFMFPSSLRVSELRSFISDTDRMGSFCFMCFMCFILMLVMYMVLASMYDCGYALRRRLEKENAAAAACQTPIWLSIYDYHTKLTPSQQDAYLEYSQRMFEQERTRLETEKVLSRTEEEAREKAHQELDWLKRITTWTCTKARYAKWSRRLQRSISSADMV
ncbi:AaceriAGR353Cp [[Ashbya] aceris (nom. inval.)]|nr:AaceriAGR353Cp [[Ashbya] aceris (nom. inval.)]